MDTFFTIGGMVAGYVTTRKLGKQKIHSIISTCKNIAIAALHRMLRLSPCILALMFLYFTVMNHQQDEPTYRKGADELSLVTNQANYCSNGRWLGASFFMMTWFPLKYEMLNCAGWLWYISCEYTNLKNKHVEFLFKLVVTKLS